MDISSLLSGDTAGESQVAFAKRLYDNRSSNYDNSWHPAFAKKLVELVNLQPGEDVLDLACGTGLVTFDAASRVGVSGSVVGLDVSEGMLGVAKQKKQRIGQRAANVELYLHDITDLDGLDELGGKTFDVIACASALVLLGDAQRALSKWVERLKPGGRLIVDVPHPRNLIVSKLMELVGTQLDATVPYRRSWVKDESSLKTALEAAGLVVEMQTFVEQAGYGRQYYLPYEADDKFVSQLMTESGRTFRSPTERREKALELFKQEWKTWSVDGRLEEVDGVYLAIARKPA